MGDLKIIVCLLATLSITIAQNCDRIQPSERRECGYPGIDAGTCRSRGCCYNEITVRQERYPWCFHGVGRTPNNVNGGFPSRPTTAAIQYSGPCLFHCTSVRRPQRIPCPSRGDGEEGCMRAGCCYDPSDSSVDRRCYFPVGTDRECPSDRCQIQSGQMNICGGFVPASMCESWGCCSAEVDGIQYCYTREEPFVRRNPPNNQLQTGAPRTTQLANFPTTTRAPTTTTQAPPTTSRRLSFIEILRQRNGGTLGKLSIYDILTKSLGDLVGNSTETDNERADIDPTPTTEAIKTTTTTTTTTTIATTTRVTTPTSTVPPPVSRISCNLFGRCRTIVQPTRAPRSCEPTDTCGRVYFHPGSTVPPPGSFKKIVGGTRAHPFSHPWSAMLLKKEGKRTFLCGAAIICSQWLVTSAHCMNRQSEPSPMPDLDAIYYTVYVGRYVGWQRKPGKQVQVFRGREGIDYMEQHEDFTPGVSRGVITNDIGVIRLRREITFNQYVQPACLPREPSAVDRTVYVSGWGITRNIGRDDSALKQVAKKILNKTRCEEDVPRFSEANATGLICAGGERFHDTCTGDSGGPMVGSRVIGRNRNRNLILRWELVGLTSLGSPSCNTLLFDLQPAIYTDIYQYVPWIRARTQYCCREQ